MREEIGSYDAKTKLPELLRRVESGESFTITNRGKPVADVVPSEQARRLQVQETIDKMLLLRKPAVADEQLLAFKSEGRA